MAAPSGTIVLNTTYVLLENYDSDYISQQGNTAIGIVLQIGDDVADWSVDDVVVFNKVNAPAFKELDSTYYAVSQNDIYLHYTAPALP